MEFVERHAKSIEGVLECFDRIIVWGSLPDIGYADAMLNWLFRHEVRICEYGNWATQRHDRLKSYVEQLARGHELPIQFLRKARSKSKEQIVEQILAKRGTAPGLVCILSAMEGCACYRYYKIDDRRWGIRSDEGKCCHYYFYTMDEKLGLCCMRVPTWAPFRLQFYCNGHSALMAALQSEGIGYRSEDNALVAVEDLARAQQLADTLTAELLRQRLDHYAKLYCPLGREFPGGWHWSLRQLEFSTDVVFKDQHQLRPLYDQLVRKSIDLVRAGDVARFLGRPLYKSYQGEVGSKFHTRIEGTCIKHHYGEASVKMYDKRGRILRIETTCNDPSFFKHHRVVVHRDKSSEHKLAAVKKTIYSLGVLRQLMCMSNRRYLEHLGSLEEESEGRSKLEKLSQPHRDSGRSWRGFNFFSPDDGQLLRAIAQGEWNLKGLSSRSLRKLLPYKSRSWISRQIKRLRVFGLLKKVGGQLRYHVTKLGRRVLGAALAVHEWVAVPALVEAETMTAGGT